MPPRKWMWRRAGRRHLGPEPAGAESLNHVQDDAAEQRQHDQLRAADVVQRLPHVQHVAVPRVRDEARAFAGEAQHAVRHQHALRRAGRAGGVADRKQRLRPRQLLVEIVRSGGEARERRHAVDLTFRNQRRLRQASRRSRG